MGIRTRRAPNKDNGVGSDGRRLDRRHHGESWDAFGTDAGVPQHVGRHDIELDMVQFQVDEGADEIGQSLEAAVIFFSISITFFMFSLANMRGTSLKRGGCPDLRYARRR